MTNEKRPHDDLRCGAKTRAGTPCQQKAGWGTNHVGVGKCKLHGGKSIGVKGNKNAVKTGENESIVFDFLDDDEKELLKKIDLDKLKQINNEIKLTDIRLRRMMKRIKTLSESDMDISLHRVSTDGNGSIETIESVDSLSKIQNIEDAITRVQGQKIRLIETKHKLEIDSGVMNSDDDDGFIDALRDKLEEVWSDDED